MVPCEWPGAGLLPPPRDPSGSAAVGPHNIRNGILPCFLLFHLALRQFCLWTVLGSAAAIIFATPWFALSLPVFGFFYAWVMRYFRNVTRETKRIDSVTRSPIYAHFSESLGGLAVIRAYGLTADFAAENEARVSRNINAWCVDVPRQHPTRPRGLHLGYC
jgi:ABC-type multidrug transport system fused ATPase/permease subunit